MYLLLTPGWMLWAAGACALVGQLAPVPGHDLGQLTATGILGWYAWYTASKSIPRLVQQFRDELTAARTDARELREAFRSELAAEREARRDDRAAHEAALGALTDRLVAHVPTPCCKEPSR